MGVPLINGLFDKTFRGLEKSLDLTWRRNEALVSNVANAETPQYRAVDLNFASELDRAFAHNPGYQNPMVQTNSKHISTVSESGAHLIEDYSGMTRGDGNNVDIDVQMGKLAYNSGKFSMSTNFIRKKLGMIRMAIREAGR